MGVTYIAATPEPTLTVHQAGSEKRQSEAKKLHHAAWLLAPVGTVGTAVETHSEQLNVYFSSR